MDRVAVKVYRGDVVESVHRASVAVVDRQGRLEASFGDPNLVTFVRSSIKPVQALPLLETGAAKRFGLSEEELAIACSSHNGEDVHVRLVEGVLEKIGLGVEALRCGAHAPYDKSAAQRVGPAFTAVHNNCSGKHAGMLAVCVHQGWDVDAYLDASHPLQQRIRALVAEETGLAAGKIPTGIDGCGAPNFALPLRRTARAFARLMDAENVRGERGHHLARLRDAMVAHPHVIAGTDRADTRFMRAFAGRVWVKAGGESCYGAGVRNPALGIAAKIEDGASRAVPRSCSGSSTASASSASASAGSCGRSWRSPSATWRGARSAASCPTSSSSGGRGRAPCLPSGPQVGIAEKSGAAGAPKNCVE
jgi:L-asparaginase II